MPGVCPSVRLSVGLFVRTQEIRTPPVGIQAYLWYFKYRYGLYYMHLHKYSWINSWVSMCVLCTRICAGTRTRTFYAHTPSSDLSWCSWVKTNVVLGIMFRKPLNCRVCWCNFGWLWGENWQRQLYIYIKSERQEYKFETFEMYTLTANTNNTNNTRHHHRLLSVCRSVDSSS